MGDDVCGAECVDGSACQHPAESCPVPAHDDAEDNPNHGRPTKYTEERAQEAIDAAMNGLSKAGCARAAGVSHSTLADWLDAGHSVNGEDFRTAFARARAQGEKQLATRGLYDDDTDPSMAKFLLSTSFDYVKTERQEVEHAGEGGGPVEYSVTYEVVDDDGE
jgi:hypothetical protein